MSRGDLDPAAIEARLREALVPADSPRLPRHGIDMSAAAVDARLRDAAALSALCLSLSAIGDGRGRA